MLVQRPKVEEGLGPNWVILGSAKENHMMGSKSTHNGYPAAMEERRVGSQGGETSLGH